MLGIAGPSRAGKTWSALRVATGLAKVSGGDILGIDTESKRMLQYAEFFKFRHCALEPPFSSVRYLEVIEAAVALKPAVIIVDSMSHEHEGVGGMLAQHEAELDRMAGNDFSKRERVKFAAWIKPKGLHNKMVDALLRLPCHFLFLFRAHEKLKIVKGGEPINLGWTPICSSRFEYEMSAGLLVLGENSAGKVDAQAISHGLRAPFNTMIQDGEQLSETFGERMGRWLAVSTTHDLDAVITTRQAGDLGKLAKDNGHQADLTLLADWLRAKWGLASFREVKVRDLEAITARLKDKTSLAADLIEPPAREPGED